MFKNKFIYNNRLKNDSFISIIIFLLFFFLYFTLRSGSFRIIDIYSVTGIENDPFLLKVLTTRLSWYLYDSIIYKIGLFINTKKTLLENIQLLSIFWSSLTMSFFYLYLKKITEDNLIISLIITFLLGFSFSYWSTAGWIKNYHMSFFLVVFIFYIYSLTPFDENFDPIIIFIAGLLSGFSFFMHQSAIFLVIFFTYTAFFLNSDIKNKLKWLKFFWLGIIGFVILFFIIFYFIYIINPFYFSLIKKYLIMDFFQMKNLAPRGHNMEFFIFHFKNIMVLSYNKISYITNFILSGFFFFIIVWSIFHSKNRYFFQHITLLFIIFTIIFMKDPFS